MPDKIMWAHDDEEEEEEEEGRLQLHFTTYLRLQQHEYLIPKLHVLSLIAFFFLNFAVHMYPHGLKRDRSPICGFMEQISLHPTGFV